MTPMVLDLIIQQKYHARASKEIYMSYKPKSNTGIFKYEMYELDSLQPIDHDLTTYITIDGTEIPYTPSQNATSVVYEINLCHSWTPLHTTRNGASFTLNLYQSLDLGQTFSTTGSANCWSYHDAYENGSYYTIAKFHLTAWTGTKVLKLGVRAIASGFKTGLFQNPNGDFIPPIVSIYSIV